MKLVIGGGVNEHGRNCFLLQGESCNIIFDCGLGAGGTLPSVTREQAENTKYLFLSHSHSDHIGGVEWLINQGFSGKIVTTEETATFLGRNIPNDLLITIKTTDFDNNRKHLTDDISFNFGRSGHCFGGVWFDVLFEGFKVIYSGDYCTKTNFIFDKIKENYANLAILDCGYAEDKTNDLGCFVDLLRKEQEKGNVVLPVPKNGRGTYIAELLKNADIPFRFNEKPFVGSNPQFWYNGKITTEYPDKKNNCGVLLVCDPQLRNAETKKLIQNTRSSVIITGNTDKGSYADKLLKDGFAKFFRIPVHSDCSDVEKVKSANNFQKTILFHSEKPI